MNTIDRYILRQLITVTFLGVLSLTLLMLLGQLFKELHTLLVESGAPPSIVIDFILQVIPFSLTFSVPWGFLTAVLLVYGRLAADNELTSMRMAGLLPCFGRKTRTGLQRLVPHGKRHPDPFNRRQIASRKRSACRAGKHLSGHADTPLR